MAVDPWMIDASGGVPSYPAQEVRLGTVTPMFAGAGASLGVRSGVRPSGSGTDLLVQAQASPNMTVKVNPGVIVAQGAISVAQGAYTWVLDAAKNLTIAAAHATLTRTDLIVVRIRDAVADTSGQRDGDAIVITGTAGGGVPSLPTDATYMTIAQIAVGAAVTTIVAGNITDKRQFTAALGGVIQCTPTIRPTGPMVGQLIAETDTNGVVLVRMWDGSAWRMVAPYRRVLTVTTPTQATILFSGIPSSLRELRITGTARCDTAATNADIGLLVNGDATAVYRWQHIFEQNNSVPASFNNVSASLGKAGTVAGASASAGVFGTTEINFSGWNSPHSTFLAYRGFGGFVDSGSTVVSTFVGSYAPAGPYTSVTLLPNAGNWVQGTEFTITGWD